MLHSEMELDVQSNIQLPGKWSGTACLVFRWIASSYRHAGGVRVYSALSRISQNLPNGVFLGCSTPQNEIVS